MLISVVLSFRNEEKNLPELVARLQTTLRALPSVAYELIFVDDDSTDHSIQILSEMRKTDPGIKWIRMSRRFGVSECVMAGMEASRGDLVVYMDADLQDPPELIADLVRTRAETEADVVYTTRLSRSGENWMKMILTKFGYRLLQRTSDVPVPFNSGDFKLLTRRVVDHLCQIKEAKPFMRGLISWVGFKQVPFFYHRQPRFGGQTHFPIYSRRVIYNFLDSALISFSDAPLKLCLLAGFLITVGAGGFMVWIFIQKLIGWALPGWSAIMAALVFFAGFQIFFMGIMGLYIGAIYTEVKRRPNYIVRERVGFES